MSEEIVQVVIPSEPKPKAEDLMRQIDNLTATINGLFVKAVDANLRVDAEVLPTPKGAPYLLVKLWKEVEPA